MAADDGSGYARLPYELTGPGLTATGSIEFEAWGGPSRLTAFLDQLVESWRGWEGVRTWEDDGGDFQLAAAHDQRGHIALNIAAKNVSAAPASIWKLQASMTIDVSDLDELARAARVLVAVLDN